MSLQTIFLGTAATIPTPSRALSAIAIKREGEVMLLDCGEGTQRQMIQARIGFNRRTKILITHMHGDHVLGVPGVLQTMSLLGRDKPLEIYGPTGIRAFLDAVVRTVHFYLGFQVKVKEINGEGVICEEKDYEIHAIPADHPGSALAYALVEKPRPGKFHPERAVSLGVPKGPLWSKLQHGHEVELADGRKVKPEQVLDLPRSGRRIVYTGDTRPSEKILELAQGADVLIHEATFADDLIERAAEDGHSTASQAATIAGKAGVGLLVLTHISSRYEDAKLLLEEARAIFSNARIAEDFMKIDVPLHRE
jgi:ribonuclease Z